MTDRRVVLLVVTLLGVFALLGLAGTIFLIDHKLDASNVAIVAGMTGTALGGLAGILASTRSGPEPTPALPVTVQQPLDQPVPVLPQ